MSGIKRIGVLTGGGDCSGLNAVVRAVTLTAINKYGCEVIGFKKGYAGLPRRLIPDHGRILARRIGITPFIFLPPMPTVLRRHPLPGP